MAAAGSAAEHRREREASHTAARLIWALVALVLAMAGWWLLLSDVFGMFGYVVIGVGVGIACALIGSMAHDALAGPGRRY